MKTPRILNVAGLALCLAAPAFADVSGTAAAAISPSATAQDDNKLYVMKEVRVVAKRSAAENAALAAAAKQALDEARLRHWTDKKITVHDLIQAVTREEGLAAYDLGPARIESMTQQRIEDPNGQEAWRCRLVLSLRRK